MDLQDGMYPKWDLEYGSNCTQPLEVLLASALKPLAIKYVEASFLRLGKPMSYDHMATAHSHLQIRDL